MPQPPEFDGNAILAVLARHKVACVVIGNYAGLLHGVDLATEDVDITPAASAENFERLASALAELGAAIRVPREPPVPLPTDGRLLATAEIWNLTRATATSTSPPSQAAPKATTTSDATPTRGPSPRACRSTWPRFRTSSAVRPPLAAPRTSPPSPSCTPLCSVNQTSTAPRTRSRPRAHARRPAAPRLSAVRPRSLKLSSLSEACSSAQPCAPHVSAFR